MTPTFDQSSHQASLGAYLKQARKSLGLSLRAVEARSDVTNGYLSQIENETIKRPSPNVLFDLARVFGLDYGDLLERAGHRVPRQNPETESPVLNGIPLRALEDLTEGEQSELMAYIAFLRTKRE
jgi:transcriptional regulator with XRE-family HTH domain